MANKSFQLITALLLAAPLTAAFSGRRLAIQHSTSLKAKITTYLDDGNYDSTMLGEDRVVLVDACAKWCGPCKLIEPFIEKSADKFSLDVVKLDVEAKDNSAVKVEFLLQGVMPSALPSLILFQNGKSVATHTGALTQDELDDFLENNIPKKEKKRELVSAGATKGYVSFGSMRDSYAI